jgi:hypothetical protein
MMPHELITSLNLCLQICLLSIVCHPIIKGYIAESREHKKSHQHTDDFETRIDTDIDEVMSLVNMSTVFLFTASFLVLCFYGTNPKTPVDPVVMKMFLWATVLYFGRDIVWILLGLLWFTGSGTHLLLTELHTPKTNDA